MKKIEAETPLKKGFGDKEVQLASIQAPRQLLIILKIAPRKRDPAGNGYGLRDWVKRLGGAVGFGVWGNVSVVSGFGGWFWSWENVSVASGIGGWFGDFMRRDVGSGVPRFREEFGNWQRWDGWFWSWENVSVASGIGGWFGDFMKWDVGSVLEGSLEIGKGGRWFGNWQSIRVVSGFDGVFEDD